MAAAIALKGNLTHLILSEVPGEAIDAILKLAEGAGDVFWDEVISRVSCDSAPHAAMRLLFSDIL